MEHQQLFRIEPVKRSTIHHQSNHHFFQFQRNQTKWKHQLEPPINIRDENFNFSILFIFSRQRQQRFSIDETQLSDLTFQLNYKQQWPDAGSNSRQPNENMCGTYFDFLLRFPSPRTLDSETPIRNEAPMMARRGEEK